MNNLKAPTIIIEVREF
jgi:hypothetical protein